MLDTVLKGSEHPRRERRRGLLVLSIFLIILVTLVAVGAGYWTWATGASGTHQKIVVVIPHGSSGSEVAGILKKDHVIRSPFVFKLLARFRGFGHGFEAGTYTNLTTNMTAEQVIAALKAGPLPQTSLSALFPEGLTVAQTAARVQDQLGIPQNVFLAQAKSGKFSLPPYLPAGQPTVEGFLFPKKYDFVAGVTAGQVIQRLLDQFKIETKHLPWNTYKSLGLQSQYDVVIVASMIEREAKFEKDRPKIARVIYNRLAKGMALQIDATVEYALGTYKPELTLDDLKVQSPYNTYLHTGLPPTPIASPGLASIEAALSPAKGSWLYYVVCDSQGHHAFTSSFNDFLRLKANPHC